MLSTQASASGRLESARGTAIAERPEPGAGIDLEQTACYACTGWHTCLVFLTEPGIRVPLCESCLHDVVPEALSRQPN